MRVAVWLLLLVSSAAAQPVPSDHVSVIREGPDLLLEIASGASGPADRIELRLNKALSRDAALEHGPAGWTGHGEGAAVILEGPRLRAFPALFRIRIGDAKAPPAARLLAFLFGEKIAERDVAVVEAPPAIVSEGLEGLLALPAIAFAGETVVARVLIPGATPPLGRWRFGGEPGRAGGETVQVAVPPEAADVARLAAQYEDPWGRVTVRGAAVLRIDEPRRAPRHPRLDGVQPLALAGEALTVCGWFPPTLQRGVLLDGKPLLEAAGGSRRSLIYILPETTAPGRHFVSGDPDAGYPDGILTFQAVRLETSVDRAMEPPHVRIRAVGAEEPVKIRVVNLDPFAASLVGGESQIVETDGGRENLALIAMRPSQYPGVGRRNLNIVFTLAEDRGDCAAQGVPRLPPRAFVWQTRLDFEPSAAVAQRIQRRAGEGRSLRKR